MDILSSSVKREFQLSENQETEEASESEADPSDGEDVAEQFLGNDSVQLLASKEGSYPRRV